MSIALKLALRLLNLEHLWFFSGHSSGGVTKTNSTLLVSETEPNDCNLIVYAGILLLAQRQPQLLLNRTGLSAINSTFSMVFQSGQTDV